MIARRDMLAIGAAALAVQTRALAQQRPNRLGVLRPGEAPTVDDDVTQTSLPTALRELGLVEGRHIAIVSRFAQGRLERLPELARELVSDGVDVLVPIGASAAMAARAASTTVPVVFFGNFDPLALGLVRSLAAPGGNVTGILISPDGTLAAKRLELLAEVAAPARRVALLAPAGEPSFRFQQTESEAAARALGIELVVVETTADYDAAFAAIAATGAQALLVGAHQYFVRDRARIIALAARHRLPAMYEWREQVVDGGLMSYGASLLERYRRLAFLIDRILKGAPAGSLPVEQPTAFRLVLNQRSASAMGLQLPPALLARVDEVIE